MARGTILKYLILILWLASCNNIYACDCVTEILVNKIQHSDFIAKIKIIRVSEPSKDGEYQTADIKIDKLYKGIKTKTIKINSALQTSCAMVVNKNTEWLIFAHYGKSGMLEFGSCSGSIELDRQLNSEKYPNLEDKIKRSVQLKTAVLKYFKKTNIRYPNPYNFKLKLDELENDQLKRYALMGNRFAIYQLNIEKDLTISNIKVLKEFRNKEISLKILTALRLNKKIKSTRFTDIFEPTTFTMVLYYYPADGNHKSFISFYDL